MRFEDVTQDVIDTYNEVQNTWFPELNNAKVKLLFDTKKSSYGNSVILAKIKKANELEKHLSRDEAEVVTGYDYILVVDKICWEQVATPQDKTRIIRHELRHTYVDSDSEDPYRITKHDFEDFLTEIELNKEDPSWASRCAGILSSIYDQMKDDKSPKRRRLNL